jgi:hypothetical protein
MYRISYGNAIRANPKKGSALIEKRYHMEFKALIFTFPLQLNNFYGTTLTGTPS